MDDGWEIVKQRRKRLARPTRLPYVSINKRGEIAMNAEAFRRIHRPANVTLLYDPKHRRIGIKFPVAMDQNFFPVRRYGRDRKMRIIRAARMLKQFGLKITQTIIFKNTPTQDQNGHPMLVISLDDGRPLRMG
jgi:hypothetical protein